MADDPMRTADSPGPHARATCGARCRDGHACTMPPMNGGIRCRMHGGASKQARRAAGRRLAAAEWARSFGEPAEDADPVTTVLDEIRWSAGHVRWLRERVQETEPDALVWGVETKTTRGSGEFPGVDMTESAKANAWVVLYGQERDRLLKQCEIAARMGIEQRFVELAERTGEVLADLIGRLLDDLNLTPEQQQTAATALPRYLQLVAAQLDQKGLPA